MKAEDIQPGMKVKFAMPRRWCQVIDSSPLIWFKGRVIEFHEKTIVVSGKNRKHGIYLDRIMCFPKDGEYTFIKRQKR